MKNTRTKTGWPIFSAVILLKLFFLISIPGFITYDDEGSITAKCNYIKDKELGGVMFWEFHGDYQNKLLETIYRNLFETK